jgi:hypothetical protein
MISELGVVGRGASPSELATECLSAVSTFEHSQYDGSVRRSLLLALLLAGCQLVGGIESKELAGPDGDAAAPDADTTAMEEAGAEAGADGAVACGTAMPTIDVPNGPIPPDARPSSSWKVDLALHLVFDPITGLTWQDSPQAPMTYDAATCACRALHIGPYSDFRLASRYEVVGILDYQKTIKEIDGPAIDETVFHDVTPAYYWTSTRYASSKPAQVNVPWLVGIGDGRAEGASQTGLYKDPSWCVRGGTPKTGPRFATTAETVTDAYTGLVWQRVLLDRTWPTLPDPQIDAACAALTLDGKSGFRLPTVKELQSIVISNKREPAIDTVAFRNTPSMPFHASPHYAHPNGTYDWEVDFTSGLAYVNGANSPVNVRCVRSP